jgi:hypothetical protein
MSTTGYDPELSFLAELERRVHDYAAQAERSLPARPRAVAVERRARPFAPVLARMTRRTAILAGLLCLLAATAFGARAVLFAPAPNPLTAGRGTFVPIIKGTSGTDEWSLRLYTSAGQLCRVLTVLPQEVASNCAPAPASGALGVSEVTSILHRFVFGISGGQVRAVDVNAGATQLTRPTRPLDGSQARALGVPRATRYFVAVLSRPLGEHDPPAFVSGLDAAGRRVGSVHVECVEEIDPPPCGP